MQKQNVSRRKFLTRSMQTFGTLAASGGLVTQLTACKQGSVHGRFLQGVASGDPLTDRVILWTRVTPEVHRGQVHESAWLQWEIATDKTFKHCVHSEIVQTFAERDYTVKVDADHLQPGTTYYYRFKTLSHTSPVGRTKTLPEGSIASVKLAVVSCSNYPAGQFHVYHALAARVELDAILHLGDYLYEYAQGEYASANAAALGREVQPPGELFNLSDYRARYRQYRSDPALQAAHAAHPFITVWDDHEVANDAWLEGAENHQLDEGDFFDRLLAAIQAYAEWMPIRPPVDDDIATLQRSFQFGDLVRLSMLDTRLVGRDKPLNLADYFASNGAFNAAAYAADIANPARSMLGSHQLNWLQNEFAENATWHVLGQQVLMGTMELPAAVATVQLSVAEFAELARLAQIAATDPVQLSAEQLAFVQANAPLLSLGSLPYNLDAWDGYPVERTLVLNAAQASARNLIVLAGDTHNAWANQLLLADQPVGVEFATPSVSSPGLEAFLGLHDTASILATEAGVTALIPNVKYTNLADRGWLEVTFTDDAARSQWFYVSSVTERDYVMLDNRQHALSVAVNTNTLSQS